VGKGLDYCGQPSFVGKGLDPFRIDPFRNMVKRNGARPFPTINIRHMIKRRKTVPYKTNALIKPIAKPAKTSIYG